MGYRVDARKSVAFMSSARARVGEKEKNQVQR